MNMEKLVWRFLRRKPSKDVAKQRLKFVLIQDRMGIDPATMETLKEDLVVLLSKYFEINQTALEMDLHREDESVALVANIPITSMKIRHGAQAS